MNPSRSVKAMTFDLHTTSSELPLLFSSFYQLNVKDPVRIRGGLTHRQLPLSGSFRPTTGESSAAVLLILKFLQCIIKTGHVLFVPS